MSTDLPDAAIAAAAEAIHAAKLRHWEGVIDPEPLARVALEAAAPALRAQERERIKAVRAVSACCGAEYHREPGRYGRWQCHACGQECDLIGVIA